MITEYIAAALAKAHYEIIEDEEPYYGEIPELPGVWASGKTVRGRWLDLRQSPGKIWSGD
jgi:hypothetical protein